MSGGLFLFIFSTLLTLVFLSMVYVACVLFEFGYCYLGLVAISFIIGSICWLADVFMDM